MKRLLIAVLAVSLLAAPAWAKSKRVHHVKKAKTTAPAEKRPPYKAFIIMEAQSGNVLEGENIHLPLPPASVTKLMLTLIVMEKLKKGEIHLTDKIPVSDEAARMGGSQVYLKPGETFTLDDMMKAVLVASANDAAYAVGEAIGGSRAGIVEMMNAKARELHMNDTHFQSMHGLPPAKGQTPDLSSCYDLALLCRTLLAYPQVLQWTSIRTAPFRDGAFIMRNHNHLLNHLAGMDGFKTGYYYKAGFNIAATVEQKGVRLIGVIMGCSTAKMRDSIIKDKLMSGMARYESVQLVKAGQTIEKEIAITAGKPKVLKGVAAKAFSYTVARDKKGQLSTEIVLPSKLEAEITKGQRLGEMIFHFGNETVGRVDIVSPVHIARLGFISRLFH
jgi:D-alanyl-D-alanine carboxypeptidase (penicillin-binding protein 5/6)